MRELAVRNLSFGYGERPVLSSISLSFSGQKLCGIVGPNGCGKSTLVSLLAGLRKPLSGGVYLDGRPIKHIGRRELARSIAYLPQLPRCPRGITVEQVLRFGREPHQSLLRQYSKQDAIKIAEVSDMLHLRPVMDRPMDELSGGQRQKAWLGMVLVQDTDIILLDEPTSALDIGHQQEVLECIRAICDRGKTVIMVIHDLAAAARFCDELVALKSGVVRTNGPAMEVVTEDLILDLYGVHTNIVQVAGAPVIVPRRLKDGRGS